MLSRVLSEPVHSLIKIILIKYPLYQTMSRTLAMIRKSSGSPRHRAMMSGILPGKIFYYQEVLVIFRTSHNYVRNITKSQI